MVKHTVQVVLLMRRRQSDSCSRFPHSQHTAPAPRVERVPRLIDYHPRLLHCPRRPVRPSPIALSGDVFQGELWLALLRQSLMTDSCGNGNDYDRPKTRYVHKGERVHVRALIGAAIPSGRTEQSSGHLLGGRKAYNQMYARAYKGNKT